MASPNTATVYLYNTTNESVDFIVNNGNTITIPAATPPAYAPATPTGKEPTLVESPYGGQGVFFLNKNTCTLSPAGGVGGTNITIDLSSGKVPTMINSAQLFVFFQDISTVSWIFLVNGAPVTGSFAGQDVDFTEAAYAD